MGLYLTLQLLFEDVDIQEGIITNARSQSHQVWLLESVSRSLAAFLDVPVQAPSGAGVTQQSGGRRRINCWRWIRWELRAGT